MGMSDTGVEGLTGALSVTVEIKGKPYKLAQPTLRDWGDLINEIREDMRRGAEKILRTLKSAGVGDETATREYLRLYDRASSIKRVQVQAALIRHTPKGVRHYFLACARAAHPELKPADAERLIDADNYRDIDREMSTLFPEERRAESNKDGEGEGKKAEGAGPSTASPRSAVPSSGPTDSAPGKSAS